MLACISSSQVATAITHNVPMAAGVVGGMAEDAQKASSFTLIS